MVWELGAKVYKQEGKFWREKEQPSEYAAMGYTVTFMFKYSSRISEVCNVP